MARILVSLARAWRRIEACLFNRAVDNSPIATLTLDDVDGGVLIFLATVTVSGATDGSESDLCLTAEPFGSTLDE